MARSAWLLLLLCALSSSAAADAADESKTLYLDGKTAFEAGRFDKAYELFRKAYMRSEKPELLFNMASALTNLDRPHEAADTLRAYLRVLPDDPDRADLEIRIRALEEKQRLLDEEHRAAPHPSVPAPAATAKEPAPIPPAAMATPAASPVVIAPLAPAAAPSAGDGNRSHRGLAIGLIVGGAVLVAGVAGVVIGLSLDTQPDPYSPSTLGAQRGTP